MRYTGTAALAATGVLIAGIAVAGCGSSDSSSSDSTTTATITKTAFVTKANAICKAGNAATNKAFATISKNTPQGQAVAVVKTAFIPSVQGQITSIKALGIPAGDEQTVNQFLGMAQADLDKVKADPTLAFSNSDQFADFAKVAHPYGLIECDKQS